jgi:hypothetical protein
MKRIRFSCIAVLCSLTAAAYAGQACEVRSGSATAALVELYTSEGCSSCPPADRALSDLRRKAGPGAVLVPLALHVSYWNQIGWVDAFSQKGFDARQTLLLEQANRRVAYTPQFFVNGSELRDWNAALPAAIRKINAIPAPLTITLKATPSGESKLLLEASANAPDARTAGALYVAVSESALATQVLRGENAGARLQHDDTVRVLLGPLALAQGKARLSQELTLPAGWRREHLQAVAFVQQANGPAILQAASTAQCDAPRGL